MPAPAYLFALLALLLLGCASPISKSAPDLHLQDGDRVVFFGDSITQAGVQPGGYITLFEAALRRAYPDTDLTVIGAGIGGHKVPDLQARMDRDVLAFDPTHVVIYIGINDVWHWDTPGRQGTERAAYEAGLNDLLTRIEAAGAQAILCTPSVIGEQTDRSGKMDALLDGYAAITREVAAAHDVPLCDLRGAFLAYLRTHNTQGLYEGILTSDGVHLNDAGNQFVAQQFLTLFNVPD